MEPRSLMVPHLEDSEEVDLPSVVINTQYLLVTYPGTPPNNLLPSILRIVAVLSLLELPKIEIPVK
jgi:hypothetical protein